LNILVLNCGSSSVKYQLFDMTGETVLAKGLAERVGLKGAILTHRVGENKYVVEKEIPDHHTAIRLILDLLRDPEKGVLSDLKEIEAVGHRVAHGGSLFTHSVLIDGQVKENIRRLIKLAPLHNGPNLTGIEACEGILPGIPQAAVFDTAFHQTMPPASYTYALPYELAEKHSIRRYGFHGTSHMFVAQKAAINMGVRLEQLKIISCHLGNGASVAAISGGQSVETSMGFTPLEGLVMGTRSGDLDPAIIPFLVEQEGLSVQEINDLLNKKSGVLGLSGVSNDFRDLEEAAAAGDERATLALAVFAHRVKKYLGAYAAIMNGLDAIIFTAGIGENSPYIRERILSGLDFLGIKIDAYANDVRGVEKRISTSGSKVEVWVIPTNEELVIARDTEKLV